MSRRQVSRCVVFLLFSVMGAILALNPSMGQVRFDEPVIVSNGGSDAGNPDIAAVDDQVFVFWFDQVPGVSDILLAHSTDQGTTFRIWNLTRDYDIQHSHSPRVVSDGKNIYVGWPGQGHLDDRSTWAPYLSRSNDRGETFHAPLDVSGRAAYGRAIMRIQDDVLYVTGAWYNPSLLDILLVKSTDFGETFSTPVRVSSNPIEWEAQSSPELVLDGDHVYMIWAGRRPYLVFAEIYFGRSTNGGKTFSETMNLSNITEERGISAGPQLAVGSKSYLYAAWSQGILQDYPPVRLLDIYFVRSTDRGETFSERLNLSKDPEGFNGIQGMVTTGDNVYVVWNGRGQIFLCHSTDGGENFSEPQNISNSRFGAANAHIAIIEKGKLLDLGITEDVIYLVWQDGPGDAVFFSVSLDGGVKFSDPENISNTPNYSGGPRIAAVGTNVYVTWMGNVAGHFQAFFIRGQLEVGSKSY